jgi:hypothetical protein
MSRVVPPRGPGASRLGPPYELRDCLLALQGQRLITEHAVDDHLARGVEIDLVLLQEISPRR